MRWETKIDDGNILVCNDVTYGQFKTCLNDLTFYNGEEAFDVRRAEAGFLCLHGADYKTNETNELTEIGVEVFGANGEDWHHHCPSFKASELVKIPLKQDVVVYKAIRLETFNVQGETVNIPWPFWEDAVEDDFVVICAENIAMLCLHFEGNNCSAWNERQCKDHCDTIAGSLRMLQLDSKLAKKIRRGVLQKNCSSKRENKRRKFKQMKDERVTL
jgi:hypothetical protein